MEKPKKLSLVIGHWSLPNQQRTMLNVMNYQELTTD